MNPKLRALVTGCGIDAIDDAYKLRDRAAAQRSAASTALDEARREARTADRARPREVFAALQADKPLPGRTPGVDLDELQGDLNDARQLVERADANVTAALRANKPALLAVLAQRRQKLGPAHPDVEALYHGLAAAWDRLWPALDRTPVVQTGLGDSIVVYERWWPLPLAFDRQPGLGNPSDTVSSLRGRPDWTQWAWAHLATGEGEGFTVKAGRIAFTHEWVNPHRPGQGDGERRYRLAFV